MSSPAQLRDELQAIVLADLLGPAGGPEEIVDEVNVRGRYVLGMLAPKGQSALPEEVDDITQAGVDTEDGIADAPTPKASTMLPSSIGMTFTVTGDASALQITARWGRYEPMEITEDRFRNKDGRYRRVWQRVPVEGVSSPIPLYPGRIANWYPCVDQPGVVVQGLVRRRGDQWIVTLYLVNGEEEPKTFKDKAWVFQPELVVEAPDSAPIFEKRPLLSQSTDTEQRVMAMLYRHQLEFAVGHGVGTHVELADGRTDRAVRLSTAIAPVYELPLTLLTTAAEIPELAQLTLDMKTLAEVPDGEFSHHLMPLAAAYRGWIEGLKQRLQQPDPSLQPYLDVARDTVNKCEDALERIRAGIALLDQDAQAAKAFRFANRAMYQQRIRSIYAADVRRGEPADLITVDIPENRTWRAFQLAFILLSLPSLTQITHPDRAMSRDRDQANPASMIADLLWFPTGGGKTEAYLGQAAYTMAIRRLQGEIGGRSGHAGVAVLMRYTLRLLTLQQFQRAAALICACELIRQDDPSLWGSEPFRIGLWVGRRTTPNWTKDAAEAIRQLRSNGMPGGEGTPHQLTNCPWCGAEIQPGRDIIVELPERGRGRTFIYCGDPLGQCPFSKRRSPDEGIPALVVDEEIYRRLPALLIATVDKFAQMPWNGRTAMLFGQVNGYCERHGFRSPEIEDSDSHLKKDALPPARTIRVGPLRPPDLIIQDELHLISGPLGTLVGLYETVVDRLSSWDVGNYRIRPKVIASTATIRRADNQVYNLFLRQVRIFPPPGLEASDNFFSRQLTHDAQHPGRRYLGICSPGVTQRAAVIRTYVAFLAAAQYLYEANGSDSDPWMTLVGYFNSLRELGGMRHSVDDAIRSRLREMDRRGLVNRFLNTEGIEELTSRLSAIDIPRILDRLETPFSSDSRLTLAPSRPKKFEAGKLPLDVLLATNMISVGVDVQRLGLMVVAGQPKTTAEYIQATSRVGRRHPGVVAVVYNWARPRDLSHYERFEHYHATFYQYVEALSVTPFSSRAMDRGLSALMVSFVRLLGLDLNDNTAASRIVRDHPHILEAFEQIINRAGFIIGQEKAEESVRQELASRQDIWLKRVADMVAPSRLAYQGQKDKYTIGLLKAAGTGLWETFTCLKSLRDVEPSVKLMMQDYGMDRADLLAWSFPEPDKNTEETEVIENQ